MPLQALAPRLFRGPRGQTTRIDSNGKIQLDLNPEASVQQFLGMPSVTIGDLSCLKLLYPKAHCL